MKSTFEFLEKNEKNGVPFEFLEKNEKNGVPFEFSEEKTGGYIRDLKIDYQKPYYFLLIQRGKKCLRNYLDY